MKKRQWIKAVVIISICFLLFANCDRKDTLDPEQCKFPFDTFPDGTAFDGDTPTPSGTWQSLNGDEFLEWGFIVDTTPTQGCAIVQTNYYLNTDNYLSVMNEVQCASVDRIEVKFKEPIQEVTLFFSGASLNYMMEVYDQNGNLLGMPTQQAIFDEQGTLFEISYRSDSANISYIRFGYISPDRAEIAIREIDMCDYGEK